MKFPSQRVPKGTFVSKPHAPAPQKPSKSVKLSSILGVCAFSVQNRSRTGVQRAFLTNFDGFGVLPGRFGPVLRSPCGSWGAFSAPSGTHPVPFQHQKVSFETTRSEVSAQCLFSHPPLYTHFMCIGNALHAFQVRSGGLTRRLAAKQRGGFTSLRLMPPTPKM